MNYQYIICHYGEIALKSGNRRFFEDKLVKNIRLQLGKFAPDNFEFVEKIHGRILIKLKKKYDEKKLIEALQNTFGIVNFSFAMEIRSEIGKIEKMALKIMEEKSRTFQNSTKLQKKASLEPSILISSLKQDEDFGKVRDKTFRISTKRGDKNFPLDSQEVNKRIGALILKKLKKKVKLENPDINLFVEITSKKTFLYCEKIQGLGGMPVGTNGRALVLLSGGIDSPVAAYFALKRGVEVDFLHFHSFPFTGKESLEKVKLLTKILEKFQTKSQIFFSPFAEIQKEIMTKTEPKLRVVLYRRMMMRIAEKLAEKENYSALITGDSIGQVASQTLENIQAIEEAIVLPILRPLIGFDKEEIIIIARKIGTYETSILPHDDCCTRFVPKHPETKAKISEVKLAEKSLNIAKMLRASIKNITLE
jgi:thiamine biosynthesis protein ThiI